MSTARFYGYLTGILIGIIGVLPWVLLAVDHYGRWVASFR